jgi:3-isopropylmalate/(R)-2-methylmalate dehydratase small subunit
MTGRAWIFGDEINTDLMAPGLYLKLSNEDMATHCLEAINPDFARAVQPGDIVVAGHNFGVGSAREQAALNFATLKVGAILAESFARIFYRNALNFGVPCLFFPNYKDIRAGEHLRVNANTGHVENLGTGAVYTVDPLPAHLMTMIQAGGLMPHLKARFAAERAATGGAHG